jgi:xanthine dehydrogenase YagS FAD-binding subunit
MRPFAYARASTIEEAVAAAADPGTAVLAGGTELLNWLRLGVAAPERLLDISRIDGLHEIADLPGGGLRIGALARLNDVAGNDRVRSDWPVLRDAIHKAASAQLRNLATIGGNLLQKTRCAYFRSEDPVPCNRREPGSGCAALHGRSDRHALFGWSDECGATHPADPAVALAALDAIVVTRGRGGTRRIPVRELHVVPSDGNSVNADTVLEDGELIEALEITRPAPRSAYVKVRERESYEYALVSAAATVELAGDGTIDSARIALGSVALRPWRLDVAEARLGGLQPDSPGVTEALDAAMAQAQPFGDSAYKARLALGAARRALQTAAGVVQ